MDPLPSAKKCQLPVWSVAVAVSSAVGSGFGESGESESAGHWPLVSGLPPSSRKRKRKSTQKKSTSSGGFDSDSDGIGY
jgi:hypothetical protein